MQQSSALTKDQILQAFSDLSDRLGQEKIRGEICMVGGAALCLAFDARESTMDVDAIARPSSDVLFEASVLRDDLPVGWLNDACRIFLPNKVEYPKASPCYEFPNLSVYSPPAEYLLAMKVMAARVATSAEKGDAGDIAFLLKHLKIDDADKAWEKVNEYYTPDKFKDHSRILLEEVCEDIKKEKANEAPDLSI